MGTIKIPSSETLTFIFAHINDLRPLDFLFIVISTLAIGYGLFRLIDWAYRTHIGSLAATVRLSEEKASSYQRLYSATSEEKAKLEARVANLDDDLASLQKLHTRAAGERDQLAAASTRLLVNINIVGIAYLKLERAFLLLTMVRLTEDMLTREYDTIAMRLRTLPTEHELRQKLRNVSDQLLNLVKYNSPFLSNKFELSELVMPSALNDFDGANARRLIDEVWELRALPKTTGSTSS